MPLKKIARCFVVLSFVFAGFRAAGQFSPDPGALQVPRYGAHSNAVPLPTGKWILSLNPPGLIEMPMAIGAGIGYRLNHTIELWSETSLLRSSIYPNLGHMSGIRQIIQVKKFLNESGRLFVAGEIRYKYVSYTNSHAFINGAAQDTLQDWRSTSHHRVFGAGLQLGYRWPLAANKRIVLEVTAGLGIKHKAIEWSGVPDGYKYVNFAIDVNAERIMETPGTTIYVPGSLRLIYVFGRGK